MLSPTELENPPVRQGLTGTCIPVSYAAGLGAITRRAGSEIIGEMAGRLLSTVGDLSSQLSALNRWEDPALGVLDASVGSGYDHLEQLHQFLTPSHVRGSRTSDLLQLEQELRAQRAVALISVDSLPGGRSPHSVTLGYDGTEFWIRDSAQSGTAQIDGKGATIAAAIQSVVDLAAGRIGEALLLVDEAPAP